MKQSASPRISSFNIKFFAIIFMLFALLGGTSAAFGQNHSPKIWLAGAKQYPVVHITNGGDIRDLRKEGARPVALAAGDFNEDGYGDLIAGYGSPNGTGVLSLHFGNINAFAPQDDASFQAIGREEFPSPYVPNALVFGVPVTPDFIAVGDFNGDSHLDLAVAAKGDNAFYVLLGSGGGRFAAPVKVDLPGPVTTLAAGDFGHNKQLIVGTGLQLMVFGGSPQGIDELISYPLQEPATQIAFGGNLGGHGGADAVIVIGNGIAILDGNSLALQPVPLPVSVSQVVVGRFYEGRGPGLQLALLSPGGTVSFAARSSFNPRPLTPAEFHQIRAAYMHHQPNPIVPPIQPDESWSIVETVETGAFAGNSVQPIMLRTRISDHPADDVTILDGSGNLIFVVHDKVSQGATTFVPAAVSTLPYNGIPVAALAVRVNIDGRAGIVAINQGHDAPEILMPIPDPTYYVNTTSDPTPLSPISNACSCTNNSACFTSGSSCSLREAILKANGDTIMLQAGTTYSLTIGRGATQDYSGNTGALYVNNSATIVGGNQNTTIVQWGTPTSGTVDMVMAVNEDLEASGYTTATGSLSNLTIQGGINHGTQSGFDGDGGCMEFDTGANGTATLTLANVTLQNCSTTDGGGGGLVIFNSNAPVVGSGANGGANISNSIFQNNSVSEVSAAGNGGGIAIAQDAHMTMTASQVLNNKAVENCSGCGLGDGGGIVAFTPQNVSATTGESFIHSSTISGNKAAGFGGGINTSASISIDQGTVISGNIAGTDGSNNTAHTGEEGGGLYLNPVASCPLSSTCTATLSKVTITGNQATGNGGGISYGNTSAGTVGALTMSFSRLAGNTTTGGSGSNFSNDNGTATVTDNWWGTNSASSTINTSGGTTTFDPYIVLTHTASPDKIRINQASTLTADLSKDNHGNGATLSGNLDEVVGLPVTFDSPVLGTIPQAQPETLGTPVSTATATFNAGGVGGLGSAHATVDQAVVSVDSNLIATATETGTTATITTVGAHNFVAGDQVTITGVNTGTTCTGYNGTFIIGGVTPPTQFTYTAPSGLTSCSGGSANIGLVILQPPSITKSFSPKTIQTTAGTGTTVSTITFAITNGNVVAIDANFTDNLPTNVGTVPGSLVVASTPNVVNPCGGTVTATAGSGTISYSNTNFPVGTCSISVDVQSAVDNIYTNSVTIDSTDAGTGNTASDTLNVINPPHIAKTFGASSMPFGSTTSLTITVSNSNQNQTLSSVSFTDSLPTNAPGTLVGASSVSSTCTGTASGSTGSSSVSLSGASLAPGASCTVSITVQGTKVGAANNSVTASDTTAGTGNTGTASMTVVKADTSTTVTSSANQSVFGQSVTFTATVSPVVPGAGTPTGTVTFLDGGSPIGTGTLSGGIATFATSALGIGNHTITTSYAGDTDFNGNTGSLTGNPQVVNKANTATTVTSSVNPSVFGQSVTFTATVSAVAPGAGTPTGTVTFLDGGSPIGTGTLSGGIATFTTSALAVGNHTITTNYAGDGNFNGSTGSLTGNPQVVNKADTTTTVTSSQNPQTAGLPVTFTATVSAVAPGSGTPTGTVAFLDGGSLIGSGTLSGGVATFTTSALSPGSHTITTSYSGDGNFNGSAGSLTGNPQVITQSSTTTTVTASAGTITLGDTVTFTATVTAASGTATGIVTFFDGNTPIGSAQLQVVGGNDQATFPTSLLSAAGSPHSITAVYQGATAFASSTSSPITETVNPRTSTTGVVLNPTTVVVGQPSTATVTVTDSGSVPPGTADAFQTTGAPATGRTGFTATLIADGAVLITGGTDANNNVLQSAEQYSVSGAAFSTTGNLNTARTGAVAVLLPNGKVLVAGGSSNGLAAGALNSAELFDPSAGTFTNTSQNMTAARFGATITLLNNGKALIAGGENSGGVLNSAELYDLTTDTFTATGNLNAARTGASATLLGTGKVLIAGGSSDGTANGALNSAEVFDPAGNAGAGTFTSVAGANPTLATGRWQNEAALLLSGKVLITGGQNSGGALTSADLYDPVADSFTASNSPMSQARANGSAVSLPSGMVLLAGGTTSQAVDLYDADSDKFDVTGSLQQSDAGLVSTLLNNGQVLVVGLTTAATPASDAELYSPSFSPLGTMAVTSSEATDSFTGACVLTPSTSTASVCTSTVTPANVATSPHTITGTYPADAVHSTSNNTASLTVNKGDTTTTVTSSANPSAFGQSVTFTATVSPVAPGPGTPTGTVTFLDGGSPIGTGTLSGGIATFTTSALAVGNHTITTIYSGDGNFNGSTGSLTGNPQVVNKADTTTTVTSSVNPSVFGQSVTFTATVSAVAPGAGTPTGTVTFLDGGSPIGTGTLSGGIATFTTSALAIGNHTITTSYSGDGNFNASTGSLTGNPQVVNKIDSTTTVTSSQNSSALGQSVTFTATVSAVAPGSGTPTGTVTFLDGGNSIGTGTLSGGVATFTTTALAAGSHTITTSYPGDGNFNGSTGSLTGNPQVVVAPPSIAKAFNPTGMPLNGISTLTITIANPAANTVAEAGVAFTDSFPANLVVATPNGLSNTCSGTATATAGSGTVSLTGGTVAVGSSCTVTVNVTSATAGAYSNTTGSVSSTNGGTGTVSNTATLNVAQAPSISKLFGKSTIPQNGSTSLSFTINNPNSAGSLTGIAFTDSLPAGLVVSTPSGLSGSCGGGTITATAGSSSVSLTGATLLHGAGCNFSVNVTGTAAGVENNTTSQISANESGPGLTASASITVVGAPVLSKSFAAVSLPVGQDTTLSFTITNPAANTVALTGVGFSDTLPSGLKIRASSNGLTANTCTGAISAPAGGTTISLSGQTLAAGASCGFTLSISGIAAGTQNNVTGSPTSNEGGTGTPATASTVVVAPAVIAKAFIPASIIPNGTSTLTFTITNPSVNTVQLVGVAFSDTFPSGLVVATPSGATGTCGGGTLTATAGSNQVSLSGGTIAVNSSCTVSVNVTAATAGTYTNVSGAVTSNGGNGNTATATLTVAPASLVITKTHTGNFQRNGSGTYTIVVSDASSAGPTDGTAVTVTDTLPNIQNPPVATAMSGTGWSCTLATLTCTRSDVLQPGQSYPAITLTVNVPINIQANFTNSATVAGGGDPNSHTASDPTHIGPPLEITLNQGGISVFPGTTGTMTFELVTVPNPGPITFSCLGLPLGASCGFNPGTITQTSTTMTLTIAALGHAPSYGIPYARNRGPRRMNPFYALAGLPGLAVVLLGGRRRTKKVKMRMLGILAGLMLLISLAGCGGGASYGTPVGSYPVTIAASSSSGSATATITLNVLR